MNKDRRIEIDKLVERIELLQANYRDIFADIEGIKDDEQEYLDNIPENPQSSERYKKAESAVAALDTAFEIMDEVSISLDDVISYLQKASQ